MQKLVALALVGLLALFGMVALLDSLGDVRQGEAAAEAARAMQLTASATRAQAVGLVVALAALVILLAGAIAVIVWLARANARLRSGETESGKWLPGPNAHWGRRNALPPVKKPDMDAIARQAEQLYPLIVALSQKQEQAQANRAPAEDDFGAYWHE